MTLVERDALLLADMLQDEGTGLGEPDPAAVRHLVGEAGGFPSPLRRAYDEVYRRWSHGGSPRDRLACLLLSHAHIAAARPPAGRGSEPRREQGMLGLTVVGDWRDDKRPAWAVSLHYRRQNWDDADLSCEAAERISSEFRKTGMTRHVQVTVDDDGAGYDLSFRLRANGHAQAEAAAESIAWACLDAAGMPFRGNISARSATLCETIATTSP
ncbi:MAG: hypothetical protein ACRDZ4_13925 [Egibacteraceae bacterium]